MKTQSRIATILLSALLPALAGCPVKNTPRQVHEGKREWTPAAAPADNRVETKSFQAFDVATAYAALGDKGNLMGRVLKPLAQFVLNANFIGTPEYRTPKMAQMINVFNTAFLTLLEQGESSAEFLQLKNDYYKTVFAGCSRDLKSDCVNADLFSADTRHTRIMTRLARELDARIEPMIKTAGSSKSCVQNNDECRNLVEERYRLLAMGARKANRYADEDFAFTYMKYARMFAESIATGDLKGSYLAETHAQIFDTLIAQYQPKDLKNPEFRSFVENFNPWSFSNKTSDLFQRGSRVMFGYAARCCMYEDDAKTKLSPAVVEAIGESQRDGDSTGPSILQMVQEIKAAHAYRLFDNLGIGGLARQIENHDPRFFNEIFFLVDRLFRDHLGTAEVDMVLAHGNAERIRRELPEMIRNYVKIEVAYMMLLTNNFMARVYTDGKIGSNEVFEEAVTRSKELTGKWNAMQAKVDLLDRMMGSYFKSTFASPAYQAASRELKAVNRNIHYLSVFPNMIVMNYFLSKMNGKRTFNSFWGSFEVDGTTILQAFFDGDIPMPWFRFGKDPEKLSRPMLLYSFEYMLSTEALKSFNPKEAATPGNERAAFFDLLFTRYLSPDLDEIRSAVATYERETWGSQSAASMNEICNYELGINPHPFKREINLYDLTHYTYAGLGDNDAHGVLTRLVGNAGSVLNTMRNTIEMRLTYVQVVAKIIESDLKRNGRFREDHPDLARIRAIQSDLEQQKRRLAQLFAEHHQDYFKCLLTIREVERRRTNRLYDEERAYLGRVYDLMKPLADVSDSATAAAKMSEINGQLAEIGKTYLPPQLPYDFDRVNGTTFKLSKYNLLMRMRKRVQDDVFLAPTASESRVYGPTVAEYNKPRPVAVYIPDGVTRDDMVSKGTFVELYLRGSKEDFISQGMVALNAKSGSYVDWRAQMSAAFSDSPTRQYLKSLIQFYLLGRVSKGKPAQGQSEQFWEVTAQELMQAYIKSVAADTMDEFDLTNARDFSVDGLQTKDYFAGRLFEKDFVERLPLFFDLMKEVYTTAFLSLDKGPVWEAMDFAQQFNNLQAFIFEPAGAVPAEGSDSCQFGVIPKNWSGKIFDVPEAACEMYGARAHQRINRVSDLFRHLNKVQSESPDATALDPRLGRPFFVDGTIPVKWITSQKNMVDPHKVDDLTALIKNFAARSGNFYRTREKVNAP